MRIRVVFNGRVQGVGFRATARWVAQQHPVTGWVRNEPDGSVLMEVQGPQHAVDAVLRGTLDAMGSRVLNHALNPIPESAEESGFGVRA